MPKSKEQFEQIKEKRKNEMIEAATWIFSDETYQNVNIDNITKRLKCSHGLFYHYFKNKDEIFKAVVERAVQTVTEIIDTGINPNESGYQCIYHIFENSFNVLKSDNLYLISAVNLSLNLGFSIYDFYPDDIKYFINQCKKSFYRVYDYIKKGIDDKTLVKMDPRDAASTIVAILKGLSYARMNTTKDNFSCPSVASIMKLMEAKHE